MSLKYKASFTIFPFPIYEALARLSFGRLSGGGANDRLGGLWGMAFLAPPWIRQWGWGDQNAKDRDDFFKIAIGLEENAVGCLAWRRTPCQLLSLQRESFFNIHTPQ